MQKLIFILCTSQVVYKIYSEEKINQVLDGLKIYECDLLVCPDFSPFSCYELKVGTKLLVVCAIPPENYNTYLLNRLEVADPRKYCESIPLVECALRLIIKNCEGQNSDFLNRINPLINEGREIAVL